MQFYVFIVKSSSEVLLLVKANLKVLPFLRNSQVLKVFVKIARNLKTACLWFFYSSVALFESILHWMKFNLEINFGINLGIDEEDSNEEEDRKMEEMLGFEPVQLAPELNHLTIRANWTRSTLFLLRLYYIIHWTCADFMPNNVYSLFYSIFLFLYLFRTPNSRRTEFFGKFGQKSVWMSADDFRNSIDLKCITAVLFFQSEMMMRVV